MPEAFAVGPFVVPVLLVGAIASLVIGVLAASGVARSRRLDGGRVGTIAERAAYAFAIGARLGFVVTNWADFRGSPLSILYLWQPGYMPLAGALAAAVIVWLNLRTAAPDWSRRALLSLGIGATAAVVLFSGVLWLTRVDLDLTSGLVRPGDPLPTFTLTDLEGREVGSATLQGSPAIINFWATWCPPCRREMPALDATYQAYLNQGLLVVGVDLGERPGVVSEFLSQTPVTYPIWLDGTAGSGNSQDLFRAVGGVGLPTTLFVAADGVVQRIRVGELNQATLANEAEALLRGER